MLDRLSSTSWIDPAWFRYNRCFLAQGGTLDILAQCPRGDPQHSTLNSIHSTQHSKKIPLNTQHSTPRGPHSTQLNTQLNPHSHSSLTLNTQHSESQHSTLKKTHSTLNTQLSATQPCSRSHQARWGACAGQEWFIFFVP